MSQFQVLYTDCCLALILGSAFANCPMPLKLHGFTCRYITENKKNL